MITILKSADGVTEQALLRFSQKARKAVGLKGTVGLLLTCDREMQQLNRRFRGKDKPTDVLSFPAVDVVADKFAGDLAISVDIASANARSFGHSTKKELCVLILHGLLHLAGYDHETDAGEMARKEARLRRELGLPASLIARTEMPGSNRKRMKSKTTASLQKAGRR